MNALRSACDLLGVASLLFLLGCNPYNPSYEQLECGLDESCPDGKICHQQICIPASEKVCGDGKIIGAEVCDDGNDLDGDGCNATCSAANCYVPLTHPTIASGLADPACPALYVHSGTYLERLALTKQATIAGIGDPAPVIDGQGEGTVVTVEQNVGATLRHLTIRNGNAPMGGGIVNRGILVLEKVSVMNNQATATAPAGGGIANLGGSLTLKASTVAGNRLIARTGATISAGAGIFSTGGEVVLDEGSSVESNEVVSKELPGAIAQGGGIAATDTAITLAKGSAVRNNILDVDGEPSTASVEGGGLHTSGGTLTLREGSSIEGNQASAKGFMTSGNGASASGGGVYCSATSLTLDSSAIRNNKVLAQSTGRSTAVGGGGVLNNGSWSSHRSEVSGNSVRAEGLAANTPSTTAYVGGLDLSTGDIALSESSISANSVMATNELTVATNITTAGYGAIRIGLSITAAKNITIAKTTIDGNSAVSTDGGAFHAGVSVGLYNRAARLQLNILESTISNNLAQGVSSSRGGAMILDADDRSAGMFVRVLNSTISGNRVITSGGDALHAGVLVIDDVSFALYSSTITNNSAVGGASRSAGIALVRQDVDGNPTGAYANSIVAKNIAAYDLDCHAPEAPMYDSGYNSFGNFSGCPNYFSGPGSINSSSLLLAPLADNGGPTRTHALLPGSTAINSAHPTGCSDLVAGYLATDQRGQPRAANGRCDIGAYELQP